MHKTAYVKEQMGPNKKTNRPNIKTAALRLVVRTTILLYVLTHTQIVLVILLYDLVLKNIGEKYFCF